MRYSHLTLNTIEKILDKIGGYEGIVAFLNDLLKLTCVALKPAGKVTVKNTLGLAQFHPKLVSPNNQIPKQFLVETGYKDTKVRLCLPSKWFDVFGGKVEDPTGTRDISRDLLVGNCTGNILVNSLGVDNAGISLAEVILLIGIQSYGSAKAYKALLDELANRPYEKVEKPNILSVHGRAVFFVRDSKGEMVCLLVYNRSADSTDASYWQWTFEILSLSQEIKIGLDGCWVFYPKAK